MKNRNILNFLLLLRFLLNGRYSKKDLIEEFNKLHIEIKTSLITNYISRLKTYKIPIKEEIIDNNIYYSITPPFSGLKFEREEFRVLNDIKGLIYSQNDYKLIRAMMEVFYKVSNYVFESKMKDELLYFDYFSSINWGLVELLEKHCETKDVLLLDYILPELGNKHIEFHVDKIIMNDLSHRMYLYGMLKGGYDFFELPIERIFTVKKVIRTHVRFNFRPCVVSYTVSNSAFKKTTLAENETILKQDKHYTTIRTPAVNEFDLVQRLLHFCPELYYISSGKIKNLVKERLENLKANYDTGTIDK